jgi:hypothetical protein
MSPPVPMAATPSPAAPTPLSSLPPEPPARIDRHRDSDIDIVNPGGRYAHALYYNDERSETITINGDRADVAVAKRLHADDASPMFWFRRGDQAWLIRDRSYVDRARTAYAPVTAYWRDAGKLEGEQWELKGPLEGLQSWQRRVEAQRRELRANPQTPGATQRLVSLDAQQRDITARIALLEKQLAALQPQLDAQVQRRRALLAAADQSASQLVDTAISKGVAQNVSRH